MLHISGCLLAAGDYSCSSTALLLLFFNVPLLFVAGLCLDLVLLFSTLCPSSFAIILMGKRELVAYFNCLPGVLRQSMFCGSSSRCPGLVYGV